MERESGYSEDICLPFGHFVLELAARSHERLVLKVFVLGTNGPKFLVSIASLCRYLSFLSHCLSLIHSIQTLGMKTFEQAALLS